MEGKSEFTTESFNEMATYYTDFTENADPIDFRGQTFEFTKAGRRGAHGLAVALLNGRLGYPAFVYLDENMDRISISPGYKPAPQMLNELNWVGTNSYKNQTLEEYSN